MFSKLTRVMQLIDERIKCIREVDEILLFIKIGFGCTCASLKPNINMPLNWSQTRIRFYCCMKESVLSMEGILAACDHHRV